MTLHCDGGWLHWGPVDDPVMQRALGTLAAYGEDSRRAPWLDSLALAAHRGGITLAPDVRRALDAAVTLRRRGRLLLTSPYASHSPKKLFPHQAVALHFLKYMDGDAYLLADAPAVGKTPVAIRWAAPKLQTRILVVAPNSAKYQWQREIGRWAPDTPVHVVTGTLTEQAATLEKEGWIVAHWEALVNLAKCFIKLPWDVVILDEAHALRNRKTQRTRAAFQLKTSYRLALTGHPFTNSPDELWSILHFLFPERYTSFWRYFGMHVAATPRYFGGYDVVGLRRPALLRWELEPFTIRRTKAEVFPSLPHIVRTVRDVELTTKTTRAEYERLCKDIAVVLRALPAETPNVLMVPTVLARITRLRQYLVDPGLIKSASPSLKYPVVKELIEEIRKPVVIFTSFQQAARRLGAFLHPKFVGYIDGRVPLKTREETKRDFHDGHLDALIVVTQAGGEALNLGRYGEVIFLDIPWSSAGIEQAEARVDRPVEGTGVMVPTTSYFIFTRATYEEKLATKVVKKGQMFADVFSSTALLELLR